MPYLVLGTDGYGRSDSRKRLRHFFEVDERFIAVGALKALADAGEIPAARVAEALARYEIDVKKPNPVTV
jgi:pyruvate dehydrogenase E1 component